MADQLYQTLKQNDYEVQILDDLLAQEDDANTSDLVIAFGGDYTYIDAASKITKSEHTTLLGINSVTEHEHENLNA